MATSEQRPVNDRNEGILRDPVMWNGEAVSYVKDIGNGDPGYNANLRQVLIMKQDGTEQVVPETEILRDRKAAVQETSEPDRRPDLTLPKSLEGLDEGGGDKNRQARPSADDTSKAPDQTGQGFTAVKPPTSSQASTQSHASTPRK